MLDTGEVLIAGGVVATPAGGTADGFDNFKEHNPMYVTSSFEIYDPAMPNGKQIIPVIANRDAPPIPRAFHHATLLERTGDTFLILLVGGVTVDESQVALGPAPPFPAPFSHIVLNELGFPTALATTAAQAELVEYDRVAHSVKVIGTATQAAAAGPDLSQIMPAAFQAGAPVPGGIVVGMGIELLPDTSKSSMAMNQISSIAMGAAAATNVMIGDERVGATLSVMDSGRALLWGGGALTQMATGVLVGDLDMATPTASSLPGTKTAISTQFHTATALEGIGKDLVFITGGFSPGSPPENRADPSPLLVEVTPSTMVGAMDANVTTIAPPGDHAAVAWESAISLGRGRVLVTGGWKLCSGDSLCATNQTMIFDGTPASDGTVGTPQQTNSPLQVPRFGHSSTVLADGSVLIVGGITLPSSSDESAPVARVVRDIELLNPRTLVPPVQSGVDLDDPLVENGMFPDGISRDPNQQVGGSHPTHSCGTL